MFGRRTTKQDPTAGDASAASGTRGDGATPGASQRGTAQAKGRPTPKRSEAEAARKKRLKPPTDRREAARRQRERMRAERGKMKAAMYGTGDERHLPARDKGPVRRFCRDFVDARRNVAEYLLPALVLILLLPLLNNVGLSARWVAALTGALWLSIIAFTILDTFYLAWRLKKELATRFPDTSTRGARLYAVMRSSQMRFLRLPKPRLKPGQKLPENYR